MKIILTVIAIVLVSGCDWRPWNTIDSQYAQAKILSDNENFSEAAAVLTPLANDGHVPSQILLGRIYALGNESFAQNFKLAFKWTSKASQSDDLQAITYLGHLYSKGAGVDKDENKAFELFSQASDKGYSPAFMPLARIYLSNRVHKNLAEGMKWSYLALVRGTPPLTDDKVMRIYFSVTQLLETYPSGNSEKVDGLAMAQEWLWLHPEYTVNQGAVEIVSSLTTDFAYKAAVDAIIVENNVIKSHVWSNKQLSLGIIANEVAPLNFHKTFCDSLSGINTAGLTVSLIDTLKLQKSQGSDWVVLHSGTCG